MKINAVILTLLIFLTSVVAVEFDKCYEGKKESCFLLGYRYNYKDPVKANKFFQKACELGDGEACAISAYNYKFGNGNIKKDIAHSKELFEKACDANISFGCSEVAKTLEKNATNIAKLLEKACELKDAKACYEVAKNYKDLSSVNKLLEKACELKNGKACYELGIAYYFDHDFLDDKTHLYFKKALEIVSTYGIYEPQYRYKFGLSQNVGSQEQTKEHEQKCEQNKAKSCLYKGISYAKGFGRGRDLQKAIDSFYKACELKNGEACFYLGVAYEKGYNNITQNLAVASDYYKKACKLGFEFGCQ